MLILNEMKGIYSRFMSDRLNRICIRVFFLGASALFFLYLLNQVIPGDFHSLEIYAVSLTLFYVFYFGSLLAIAILVLNGLRKLIFR
jgi:hypothetical protein